ncbi:primosomal protein [Cellulomonas taurus]|uniref:primosomal protein n=1 Tax=Cellulomonas taurus TaxID=2729175 RepID=UPI00145F6DEF|nr:primosomal protein [Cellulomonas taurus]
MAIDPRAALDRFIAALEAHYTAVATRQTEDDSRVDDAYDVLADAFEVYDEALVTIHGESTPFFLEDEDLEDDEHDDDDDEHDDDEHDDADGVDDDELDYDLDDHLDEDED